MSLIQPTIQPKSAYLSKHLAMRGTNPRRVLWLSLWSFCQFVLLLGLLVIYSNGELIDWWLMLVFVLLGTGLNIWDIHRACQTYQQVKPFPDDAPVADQTVPTEKDLLQSLDAPAHEQSHVLLRGT